MNKVFLLIASSLFSLSTSSFAMFVEKGQDAQDDQLPSNKRRASDPLSKGEEKRHWTHNSSTSATVHNAMEPPEALKRLWESKILPEFFNSPGRVEVSMLTNWINNPDRRVTLPTISSRALPCIFMYDRLWALYNHNGGPNKLELLDPDAFTRVDWEKEKDANTPFIIGPGSYKATIMIGACSDAAGYKDLDSAEYQTKLANAFVIRDSGYSGNGFRVFDVTDFIAAPSEEGQ